MGLVILDCGVTAGGLIVLGKSSTAVATNGTIMAPAYHIVTAGSGNIYHGYDSVGGAYKFLVSYNGTVSYTALSQLSDEREKENITNIDRGLSEVLSLRPVKFDWKNSEETNKAGFIAQEMQEVLPEFVAEAMHDDEGNTRLRVSTAELIPVLVKAIQEQQATITALEARIAALES